MSLGKPPGKQLADAILRPERSASLAAADDNEWGAWDADDAAAGPAVPSAAPTAPRKTEVERLREERRARKAQLRARRI